MFSGDVVFTVIVFGAIVVSAQLVRIVGVVTPHLRQNVTNKNMNLINKT